MIDKPIILKVYHDLIISKSNIKDANYIKSKIFKQLKKIISRRNDNKYFITFLPVRRAIKAGENEASPLCTILATPYADIANDIWRKSLIDYLSGLNMDLEIVEVERDGIYALYMTGKLNSDMSVEDLTEIFHGYAENMRARLEK